jgi:hypothetical protein
MDGGAANLAFEIGALPADDRLARQRFAQGCEVTNPRARRTAALHL